MHGLMYDASIRPKAPTCWYNQGYTSIDVSYIDQIQGSYLLIYWGVYIHRCIIHPSIYHAWIDVWYINQIQGSYLLMGTNVKLSPSDPSRVTHNMCLYYGLYPASLFYNSSRLQLDTIVCMTKLRFNPSPNHRKIHGPSKGVVCYYWWDRRYPCRKK